MTDQPTQPPPTQPLSGITVLDLSRLLPGPMASLHLADLGAEVIKVEDTGQGDYARWQPPLQKTHSSFFLSINRNKQSIAVDLGTEAGKDVLLRLVDGADVLLESFRPGVMDRLGLGYDVLKARNPRLVYCAVTGYGQDGPYRDRAGHDINYLATAGVLSQIGTADGQPALPNLQIADLLGGAMGGVMGILAALVDRHRTGTGRFVDVSMTDMSLAHAVIGMMMVAATGQPAPAGRDVLNGGLPCYGVYATKDGGHLAVGALEPKFWVTFCQAAGRSDLIGKGLALNDAAAKAEVADFIASKTLAEWTAIVEPVDCCVTPVKSLTEALEDPQIAARGMVVAHDHPTDGPVRQFAFPVKMSDFAFAVTRPAPLHGQHTAEILADRLGLDPAEIAHLLESGAVKAADPA